MPISKEVVTKRLTLKIDDLKGEFKIRAKNEAGKIIVESINDFLDSSKSPVSGGRFKAFKKDKTPSHLFEKGDMRSAITFRRRKGNDIETGIWKKRQAIKAFNHNTGDTLPKRQLIPGETENFKRKIMSEVNSAIQVIREEQEEEDIEGDIKKMVGDLLS